MKVVHILNEIRPSGAEVMLKLAAPYWKDSGCELIALATAPQEGEYAATLRHCGYTVLHYPVPWRRPMRGLGLAQYTRSLAPDIVHIHTERNSSTLSLFLSLNHLNTVRTIHNSFPYCGHLRIRKSAERFLQLCLGSTQLSISSSVYHNELRNLHNPTTLCWNWFDEKTFRLPSQQEHRVAREQLGIGKHEFIVVSIGNGNEVKNYTAMIEALPLLKNSSTSDRSIRYFMVGNEHPSSVERKLASHLNLQNQVVFTGPKQDVLPYLWAANVFVMPSLYEGFGVSAVEALATGIPTILSDCPGLRDFSQFAFDITWTAPESLSIASALMRVIATKPLGFRNSENARIAHREFNTEYRSAKYFQIWKDILARNFQKHK